ncbi:unnamed protein product [Candidula unifasciata]|uniref:Antistasin-like domain-containing protein n=1 Tax=Candidula unifasciata TaxID=100452 RepID=A0A8S4AAU7_9EUPU|nr:unnamed protein product [Candidula unifasciata]
MELKDFFVGLVVVVAIATIARAGYVSDCAKQCPYGHVQDSTRCQCVVRCPLLKCVTGPFPCKEYQRDANGCPTCKCLDRCFRSRCPRICRAGTETYIDEKGCTACRCKPQPTVCNHHVRCSQHCPQGYAKDANNCDTCQCQTSSSPCGWHSCGLTCQYGRVRDHNGCELCRCNPKPLCGQVCPGTCHRGRVLDAHGCPTCQCLG